MKLKSLACLFLAAMTSQFALGGDPVLLWDVTESATIDGTPIRDYLDAYQASISDWDDNDDWFAARVQVMDEGWAEPVILGLWFLDPPNPPFEDDGYLGVELGDSGSGYWGATGNQSSVVAPDGFELTENMLFTLQIGCDRYDETIDDAYWTTLAESAPVPKSSIESHIYETFNLNPMTESPWSPSAFTSGNPPAQVPEPATGLLAMLGAAVLVLRRRIRK